jgi:hypothetical protein
MWNEAQSPLARISFESGGKTVLLSGIIPRKRFILLGGNPDGYGDRLAEGESWRARTRLGALRFRFQSEGALS